jgi:hypothetical protein
MSFFVSINLGGNTLVHGSNARNLSGQLSLPQLAKTFCLSYYCLCLLVNKIGEKCKTGSSSKQRGWDVEEGGVGHGGEMAQTMCAHMNKCIKKEKKEYPDLIISLCTVRKQILSFRVFLFF